VLSLIYIHVAVCSSVQYVVKLFASICYLLITRLTFLNILFMLVFLFCTFVSYFVRSVFFVLFYLLFLLLFITVPPPMCVQVYRPLPPGGNPFAVNKFHIIYIILSDRICI